MTEQADFQAEGLLDGVDGDARHARRELLELLAGEGVPLDELKHAVAENRLALLPLERVLAGENRYTLRDVAERAGLDPEFQARQLRALGLAVPDPDECAFGQADIEAACTVKTFLDAGFSEEGILEISRVMGDAMAKLAATIGAVAGSALLRPGDTERDVGLRYAQAVRDAGPLLGPLLTHVLGMHQRENIKQVVVSAADIEAGSVQGAQQICVAFADLVDFTRLGEDVDPGDLGSLASRLTDMTLEVAQPGVRLVKTIGDAVMLVGRQGVDPLIETSLGLLEATDQEGEHFPQLRIGVACGEALGQSGDWYGRPVNLASRVTGFARPGSVLATNEVHEQASGDYAWSKAGFRRFKGIREPVGLMRVRRPESSPADAPD